jgi:hypothetical protein
LNRTGFQRQAIEKPLPCVKEPVSKEVRAQASQYLFSGDDASVDLLSQSAHLLQANAERRRRLLLVMHSERTEEAREVCHAGVRGPEAQKQVPIEGIREALIDAAT